MRLRHRLPLGTRLPASLTRARRALAPPRGVLPGPALYLVRRAAWSGAPPLTQLRTPRPVRCLQAFPDEQEFLFPPGTYLTPVEGAVPSVEPVALTRQASRGEVLPRSASVKVVEVEPDFPTM